MKSKTKGKKKEAESLELGGFCFCIDTCPLSSLWSEAQFQDGHWNQQFQPPLNPGRYGVLFSHFTDEEMEAHRAQVTCWRPYSF